MNINIEKDDIFPIKYIVVLFLYICQVVLSPLLDNNLNKRGIIRVAIMTATGHAIIGTVIAAKVANPALAIPIAIASHFLADLFPHWDTGYHRDHKSKVKFFIESAIDVLASFGVSWLMISLLFPDTNLFYAFFIVIMAQLPDWLTAPYLFFDMKFFPFNYFYKIQKYFDHRLGMPWGVINQVAILAAIIILGQMF